MKRSARVLTTVMLLVVSTLTAAGGLTEHEKAKLHPEFRALLSGLHPELGFSMGSTARVTKSDAAGGTITYDAIIRVSDPHLVRMAGVNVNSSFPGFVTARVTAEQLLTLAHIDAVSSIDPGTKNRPSLDVSTPETGAGLLHGGFLNGTSYKGNGAIVLVYDTGIDWKHMDFRSPADQTKSRILAIWDQTLTPVLGETVPSGLYGVEYSQSQINAELSGMTTGFVRERDFAGHGTYVTGVAAGNGRAANGKFVGMAPEADIIVVKGGDGSFSEARIIDGLTYAATKAGFFDKPVAVNWSFGNSLGPHDGTYPYELALNSFVSTPGRAVVVAAGNGGDLATHVRGMTAAGPGNTMVQFNIASYTPNVGTGNDQLFLEVWLTGNVGTTATILSPHGHSTVTPNDQSPGAVSTPDGSIMLWSTASYTTNGDHVIQLSLNDDGGAAPAPGTWTLTLAVAGVPVVYDGWISSSLGPGDNTVFLGGDAARTVSSPAISDAAIGVGSYVTKWSWPSYVGAQYVYDNLTDRTGNISTFSSMGPTRDGRLKPDITAPGQGITSALSASVDTSFQYPVIAPGQKHFLAQGTSSSAPHVTGAAALILGVFPEIGSAELKSLLTSSANADAFTSSVPNPLWGYGKLDVADAMTRKFSSSSSVARTSLSYDLAGANTIVGLTGSSRLAQKITPTASGRLEALQLNLTTLVNRPILGAGPLICELYSDNGGIPGSLLGNSVNFPLNRLSAGTLNYISMLDAGVTVASGTNYHLVIRGTNPTDTILVRADQVGGGRSSIFNGSAWSPLASNTLRMRAIVATGGIVNSVSPSGTIASSFSLEQNYPNPFNPATTINYTLAEESNVTLTVYDILGREIRTLVKGEMTAVAHPPASWDGTNESRQPVASGVYFYRLEAKGTSGGSTVLMRKMMLLK